MKIVNIIGGIGNQMFQYAFAIALKERHINESILVDISHFKHYPLHNGYELDKILKGESLEVAKIAQLQEVTYYVPHYRLSRVVRKLLPKRRTEYINRYPHIYDSEVWNLNGDVYFEGYWQSWKFYEHIESVIRDSFDFCIDDALNIKTAEKLKDTSTVGIHIRRGDYVGNKVFGGISTLKYYTNAIEYMKRHIENPVYYIFSNDIDWCREYFVKLLHGSEIIYVSFNVMKNSYKDMFLLSQCKNLIMANSSFSWWGAFLNVQGGIICCPERWTNRWYGSDDIILLDWVKIKI